MSQTAALDPWESDPGAIHRLKERLEAGSLLINPARRGYFSGESITAELFGLDGSSYGRVSFRIEACPGSGFAGQVYQAVPEGAPGPAGLPAEVAIKILRPKAGWKNAFRDLLFRLSFQVDFAPRWRVEAVRTGLIWQALLRAAAGIYLETPSAVAKPYGYFWDETIGSYAEVHEWVSSRPAHYTADAEFLRRLFKRNQTPSGSEMARKCRFMDRLVQLCQQIGAIGLSRQFEWYSLVSQPNVLVRRELEQGDEAEFVAVDCRPGLAIPFFLPLSPVHARIIVNGLKNGLFRHYDEVDFNRLDAFLAAHPEQFSGTQGLIKQLKQEDERYRSGLPDLWQRRTRLLLDKSTRARVTASRIEDWRRSGRISGAQAQKLEHSRSRYSTFLLLDFLPFVGSILMRFLGNERYREHLLRFWFLSAYRKASMATWQARDLLAWLDERRISGTYVHYLMNSPGKFWLHKLILGWLPAWFHRLAVDSQARRQAIDLVFLHPIRLLFGQAYREEWLAQIIDDQAELRSIPEEQAYRLRRQLRDGRLHGFVRDLGLMVGLEVISKAVYLALGLYGLSSGNFLPLALAALGPIPPSGLAREAYRLAQLAAELPRIIHFHQCRTLVTGLLACLIAPWRGIGNLYLPLELFASYPTLALLLGDYYASRLVQHVPVLGGRGSLLEYWAFQITYNLPLALSQISFKRRI